MFDDNIWQQLDYSLQLNNSRKGAWSAAFTITVIIEFLRTHESRPCRLQKGTSNGPLQTWLQSSSSLYPSTCTRLTLSLFQMIEEQAKELVQVLDCFIMTSEAQLTWPPVQLIPPWAILPLCVMVSSHASDIFSESQVVFFVKICEKWKQLLLYSSSCSYLSPRKSSCQWSWPKTIISMPIDLNLKNKTIPKTMETHAENMSCSMQKSKKKTRWMNYAPVRQRHVHLLSPTILLVFISEDRWWLSRCGAKHLKHSKSFPTLQTIQTTSWYADI